MSPAPPRRLVLAISTKRLQQPLFLSSRDMPTKIEVVGHRRITKSRSRFAKQSHRWLRTMGVPLIAR